MTPVTFKDKKSRHFKKSQVHSADSRNIDINPLKNQQRGKHKETDQWKKPKILETDPHKYIPLTLDQGAKLISGKRKEYGSQT